MTTYNNFINDFPARCCEVLDLAYNPCKAKGREVTLLIMTATAAFLFPFERLRSGMPVKHQARDRDRFPELAKYLDSEVNKKFKISPFFDSSSKSWSMGKAASISQETPLDLNPLPPTILTNEVLAIIRNALARVCGR
jgi:hypothetical protein